MRYVKHSDERGSAAIEFVTLGLLLIVPLVYLVLVVAQLQAATLAAEGAARQAARDLTRTTASRGMQEAARDISIAIMDFGLGGSGVDWQRTCNPDCVSPGAAISVDVTVRVPMPLVPPALQLAQVSSVAVHARSTQLVSLFAGTQ